MFWPVITVALTGLLFIGCYARYLEPNMLKLRRHLFEVKGLPATVRLFYLSDIHNDAKQLGRMIKRYHREIRRAHLVLVGGDWCHRGRIADSLPEKLGELLALNPRIVGVLGNHDYMGRGAGPLIDLLGDLGVCLLINDSIILSDEGLSLLQIVGSDDVEQYYRQPDSGSQLPAAYFRKVDRLMLRETSSSPPTVLLTHNPHGFDQPRPLALPGLSLVLAGHTHGGQVVGARFWLGLFRQLTKSDRFQPWGSFGLFAGLKTVDGLPIIVSRGISGWPVRLGRPPEVHAISLTPK